jgi:hypothetical protein
MFLTYNKLPISIFSNKIYVPVQRSINRSSFCYYYSKFPHAEAQVCTGVTKYFEVHQHLLQLVCFKVSMFVDLVLLVVRSTEVSSTSVRMSSGPHLIELRDSAEGLIASSGGEI